MKYVVIELHGEEFIFLFPKHAKCSHLRMAEAIRSIRVDSWFDQWVREFRESEIVSAGFVDSEGNCYGESESLKIASRKCDTELLSKQYK